MRDEQFPEPIGALRGLSAIPGGWIQSPGELRRAMSISTRLERYAKPVARSIDVAASAAITAAVIATAI